MADEEHLKILRQGVAPWNQWRKQNPEIIPDLSGAILCKEDLRKANLLGAVLGEADLSAANLSEANLIGANLTRANLSEADLWKADLSVAILMRTNLLRADLSEAVLIMSTFSGAILIEANLSGATVALSMFGDIDLSTVKGLDTAIHLGPSTIGIDTVYRSKGNIPAVFLQGAGIPDTFITQIAFLVEQTPQYYTCFISHSSKDKRFCDRLYADFRAKDVQAYYFPKNARWGESVWGEIGRGIKRSDKVVVVCSKNSLQSSPVLREIERTLNREDREGKNILFPIRIDNYLFECWEHQRKADVVSKVVGDFRGWDQDAAKYDMAFEKLLRALEAEDSD